MTRRDRIMAAAVGLSLLVGAWVFVAAGLPDPRAESAPREAATHSIVPDVPGTGTAAAAAVRIPGGECHEEDACFNSCTIGTGGPCDLSATLPNGATFRVTAEPVPAPMGVKCRAGEAFVTLTVNVALQSGQSVAGAATDACMPAKNPLAEGPGAELLPGTYRIAACRYHKSLGAAPTQHCK